MEAKSKRLIAINKDGNIKKLDWIIFALLAALCFLLMQQGDILHTGGSSFALLRGHILDFYDYNAEYFGTNNYMITTYVLFAIWNIPLALMGLVDPPSMSVPYGVLMWYKALPTLFFLLSAIILFRIGVLLHYSIEKSKWISYLFLTTPVAFFSQFIFGQYDVFTAFFMVLALYFYFKKSKYSMFMFSLFFGIAGTFKYFSFLFFIPILLFRVKKIQKILIHLLIGVGPIVLVVLPFLPSEKFISGVFGFGATGYIFDTSIKTFFGTEIYLIPVIWVALCVWSYLKDMKSGAEEESQYTIYIGSVVVLIAFGFSFWHPQWLMLAAPFMALSVIVIIRTNIVCLLDILLMIAFSAYVVNWWPNHVDQQLFTLGALGNIVSPRLDTSLKMSDIYVIKDVNLLFTCFTALLLASTIIKHPKFSIDNENLRESNRSKVNWFRGRFLAGVSIFIIPMFICLVSALTSPMLSWGNTGNPVGVIPANVAGQSIEQIFTPTTDTLSEVCIKIGTYMRENDSQLIMEIVEPSTNKILTTVNIDVPNLIDNAEETVKFDPVKVEQGTQYILRLMPEEVDDSNFVAIYRTEDNSTDELNHARVNGADQTYNLAVKIYGN